MTDPHEQRAGVAYTAPRWSPDWAVPEVPVPESELHDFERREQRRRRFGARPRAKTLREQRAASGRGVGPVSVARIAW